jgi:TPR repeat protein
MGQMPRTKNECPQHYAEATKWFHLAADQGNSVAQLGLGAIYFGGEGVPQADAEGPAFSAA